MADDLRMALQGLLRKAELEQDADFLREGVRALAQALMELEVAQHLGAERYERTAERRGERNGYRERDWDTRAETVELRVPRVRDGSYFPALLEPRRRAERALAAVVQEAYVQGVSTRRVDDLVKALGMEGVSKSQVSRVCQALDAEVERFRARPLEGCKGAKVRARSGGALIDVVQPTQHRLCPDGSARCRGPGQRRLERQSPVGTVRVVVRHIPADAPDHDPKEPIAPAAPRGRPGAQRDGRLLPEEQVLHQGRMAVVE
jgi:hypothetical protein